MKRKDSCCTERLGAGDAHPPKQEANRSLGLAVLGLLASPALFFFGELFGGC